MNKKHLSFAVLILLLMLGQGLYFAWDTGQTIDETFYNGSGYAMVRYNDYERLGEHPPLVMQLGSLPLLFLQPNYPYEDAVYLGDAPKPDEVDLSRTGSKFLYQKGNNPQLILFLERIPVILITMLGGFFVFRWSYELFGFSSALVSLVLYAFCSNMIAHGSLFTTDMAVAIFFFISLYFSHRIFISSPLRNAIFAGVFAGLTLLSKMSGLILIPTVFLLFCIAPILQPGWKIKMLKSGEPLNKSISVLSPILFICAAALKITGVALGSLCLVGTELTILRKFEQHKKMSIWIRGLLIAGWISLIAFIIGMTPKRPFSMVAGASLWCLIIFIFGRFLSRPTLSEGIINLAKLFLLFSFVCALVIIIDFTDNFTSIGRFNFFRHYVRSFNIAFGHVLSGHQVCPEGSFVTCDWRYFLASLSIKTPLTTIFLSALGLLILLKSKISALTKAHLILPPLIFLFVASFLNRINIGIRHVLAIYPFLFLMAGVPVHYLKRCPSLRGVTPERRDDEAISKPGLLRPATIGVARNDVLLNILRKVGYTGVSVACLWVVSQNLSIAPHHLTYFNEFVRTPENGAKLVSDSSLNFGQDNRRLTEVVNKLRIPKIKISGIATNAAEYDYYGISWEYMTEKDFVSPDPGYYAIDSTVYNNLQTHKDSWFRNRKPLHSAGKTIYVFKVQ